MRKYFKLNEHKTQYIRNVQQRCDVYREIGSADRIEEKKVSGNDLSSSGRELETEKKMKFHSGRTRGERG